ncbi:MAG: hypothetical protein AAF571_13910 [Verrucomicrobiota bacterium]
MIDFANDGPLGIHEVPLPSAHATIGIGSGAVNIIDQIRLNDENAHHCYIIDTDEQCVRGSVVSEKFLLGKSRVFGMGCGSDRKLAESLWAEQELEISEMLSGIETAFVIASLGGGTGSACAPQLVRWLKKNQVRVVVFAVTPFRFEGEVRKHNAASALRQLHSEADAVFTFSNERGLHLMESERDIRLCLHEVNKSIAGLTETLRRMVSERGFSQVTWEDITGMGEVTQDAFQRLETTWAGTGEASGSERLQHVVLEALQSPLFEDGNAWQHADKAFAGLIGGSDFSMSEYQTVLRALKADLPDGFPIASGALVDPAMEGRLRLTLLFSSSQGNPELDVSELGVATEKVVLQSATADFDSPKQEVDFSEEETAAIPGKEQDVVFTDSIDHSGEHTHEEVDFADSYIEQENEVDLFGEEISPDSDTQKYFSQQEELQLEKKINRGRFEKTERTILNGQDLDQPTFQRMKVPIRL